MKIEKDREKMHKKTNKQKEKKHRIIVTGDRHAWLKISWSKDL
jgi:hypothetical protein